MIKPIMKNEQFLKQPSTKATKADLAIAQDLQDTLIAHHDHCVGMAANMIGQRKNIIVVDIMGMPVIMINPSITKKSIPYQTTEGCLSLTGQRPTLRFKKITIKYLDTSFKTQIAEFSDFTAEIIQHEIDHTKGILI